MSRARGPGQAPSAAAGTEPLGPATTDWSPAFDAIGDMVCLLARDGSVLRCNESAARLLGLRVEDVPGRKCFALMHGSRTFCDDCPFLEMLRTGKRESLELALGERWYEVTVDPLFGPADEIVGAVHIVRDVTAAKRARDAAAEKSEWLAASNALALDLASLTREADLGRFLARRLRELTGSAAVAFSEYDPAGRALTTRTIELAPGALRKLTGPLLRRLEGTRSPVSADAHGEILDNRNATRATLTEASFGAIPPSVDVAVRTVLGLDRFVGLAYVVEGELYGTSVIALKAGTPDPPRELLDSFAGLAAVSLRRRRAERELRAKTAELDQLFALSGDILGIADAAGVILRVNPAWASVLGWSAEETEGRSALDFVHPDDVETTRAALAGLAAGQPITDFVNRQRHRDGAYRLVEWRITPYEGGLQFAIGRDITEKVEAQTREEARRREAEDVQRRANAYNRSLIEASLDPLVTIGPDRLITDVNEATVVATGRTREELVGTDFADYFTEPAKARAVYEQVCREGAVHDCPLEIRHDDGHVTEVRYNASVYRAADGNAAGVFAAARDVGELTAANRALQEFVYSVSHDLRAPLRAIDGFSHIVMQDYGVALGEQGRSDLQRVRAAAERMGELIDALLSLSRIGRGGVALAEVDLSAIARRIVDELRETDPERRVDVTIEAGLVVQTDPALVDIVLENLLGNAWKFTARRQKAHVRLGSLLHDDEPVFFVRDDGAGFEPADADKLFTPFQRLHPTEQFPGTGIGLATVARVLARLGGRWWAEGEVDRGATFYFTLSGGDGDRPGR